MSKQQQSPIYQRIVLKFSGEALLGNLDYGIDGNVLHYLAQEVRTVADLGVQVAIIIGGGNFFRGANLFKDNGVDRITGDHMGMLATMLNALAMREVFVKEKLKATIMSALPITGIINAYNLEQASALLSQHNVLILAGGTGNPLVTTDTALSLRGIELKADLLLKATNVDGVYSSDPRKDTNAKLYTHLTYSEALTKELMVMDIASFVMCRDHDMKLRVFNMRKPGALLNIVMGKDEGTLVTR
jgi:uridylate kinase